MRARVERGYYVFACPVGCRYAKANGHGKMLVRDEPLASIVQEALEGYASGRFQIQAEVKRFLEAQPLFPKVRGGIVLNQTITDLLTRPVYAGYVEASKWDVSLRKGHHPGLISFETFLKIRARLTGAARAPNRQDLDVDFPLRGAVVCGHCGRPLTGYWAKGRSALHPYYHCPQRGCVSYGKSIRRDVIESQFELLLKRLQPSANVAKAACAMFEDLWNHRLASSQAQARSLKTEIASIQRQSEQFLDRIADAQIPSIVTAYENRIRKLEEQKALLAERVATCGRPLKSFDEAVRTALDFLANPGIFGLRTTSTTSERC